MQLCNARGVGSSTDTRYGRIIFQRLGSIILEKKKLQQLISIRMHTMDLKVTQSNIITLRHGLRTVVLVYRHV